MKAAQLVGPALESSEYAERFNAPANQIISKVELTIKNEPGSTLDVLNQNENYVLDIANGKIKIEAENTFSASRAFQTLMQVIKPEKMNNDSAASNSVDENTRSAYTTNELKITDSTPTPWRHISLDACSHYVPVRDLKRYIDSAALLKANILILNLLCNHSAPFSFKNKNLEWASKCSWTKYHFYDEDDLKSLQEYALMRGVIIVPQLNIPFEGAALKKANSRFLVNSTENKGWIAINDEQIGEQMKAFVNAIVAALFDAHKVSPIVHLGGAQVAGIEGQKPIEPSDLLQALNHIVNVRITKVLDSNVLGYFDKFAPNNTIIHFTTQNDKQVANTNNFKQISSYNLFTHQMHPDGGYHYFWQDTWYDLARQNVFSGSNGDLGIGGGIIQTGDHCYGRSCEQHMFQRCFAVYDKLWMGAEKQNSQSSYVYQQLGCHFEAAGIGNGPLEIGAPCPGYQGKRL